MSAATKRFMNWTNVTFTPVSGTVTTYTGVTSVKIDSGGSLAKLSGDADRYNTTVVNDFNEPSISIELSDVQAANANPVGTVGTFTATLNDAKNGAGTGAVTYTLANAVVAKTDASGAHRQFGRATVMFECFSTDGVTNPLSTSVAT